MNTYSRYRTQLGKSRAVRLFRRLFHNVDRRTLIKNLALSAVALALLGALFFLAAYAWYSRDLPDPDTLLTRDVALSTKIYDRTGEHLLYTIAGDKERTLVPIDQIPENLKDAVIAAEDEDFYSHNGISIKGLSRAIIFRGNRGGGSTITQQLVKNAILDNSHTFGRKFKEIILSLALERNFSKDQILQMYFNEIGYGGRLYGVESASQSYYGKHVSELTLSECATLARLPQRPTAYLNDFALLKERRDWVLDRMLELGSITQEEADAAKADEITITVAVGNITAPHFVLWVKEQLVEKYGEREVEEGGLKIITTLDYDKQKLAEKSVADGVLAYGESYGFNNAGLVSIDPKTGQILAMVGSADYFNDEIDGQVNVALRPLQPGSSFKPIVYAAGFEKGYTPNTLVWDVNTTFATATGSYEPKNYSLNENGPVTLRKALQGSLNIAAVKMLYLVGVERALTFAERLGYTTFGERSNFGLAIVLGGAEVKLVEHTNAFATFANNGKLHTVSSVLKVEDAQGEVLQEWKAEENLGTQVVDSNVAATLSNVLSDNDARSYVFGASNYLTLGSRPAAAKTGTTNDYNDAWTMGYTPSLAAGVWVGNTDGTEMYRSADGSKVAAPIWNSYMRAALEGTTIEAFPAANIATTGKAMLDGVTPTTTFTIDTVSGKLATSETPERFRKDMTCGEYHEILHYVDKDAPLDAVPSNPERDPYYAAWEASLADFITRHNATLAEGQTAYESCVVPTEEDDVHTAKNQPEIKIDSPKNGDEVSRSFTVDYDVELKRDFGRVELSIDGTFIDSSTNMDSATVTLPSWVTIGSHTLTATVFDDADNEASDSVTIDVTEASASTESVHITNPFNNQTIIKIAPTYLVTVEIADSANAAQLLLTAKDVTTGNVTTIGEAANPSAISSILWNLPSASTYIVSAAVTYQNGESVDAEPVKVFVKEL